MGGRGGAPRTNLATAVAEAAARAEASPAPAPSLAMDPAREFAQWLANPRDIPADSMGAFGGRDDRINILLPDRDASLEWNGRSFVVRDTQTDQLLPFKGQRHTTVYRQISRFYGRKVEAVYRGKAPFTVGSDVADLRQTPAAHKYGKSN